MIKKEPRSLNYSKALNNALVSSRINLNLSILAIEATIEQLTKDKLPNSN